MVKTSTRTEAASVLGQSRSPAGASTTTRPVGSLDHEPQGDEAPPVELEEVAGRVGHHPAHRPEQRPVGRLTTSDADELVHPPGVLVVEGTAPQHGAPQRFGPLAAVARRRTS